MEDLNTQIQEIIALKLSWEQLTPKQKALFNNSEEIFNSLVSNFETGAVVNAALLAQLVEDMNTSELDNELKASLAKYSLDQQKLIIKLVNIRREEIRLEKILKNQEALNKIKPEVDKLDPKQDPRQEIIKIAHQVIGSSNKVAVEKFISIYLISQDLELAKTIALGKNKLYEEISKAIAPATDQNYLRAIEKSDPTKIIDPQTNIVIDTSKIPSPDQVKPSPTIKVTPANSDFNDRLKAEVEKLQQIENNPVAQKISRTLITQISDKQLSQITRYMDPSTLQQPTQSGQQAAAIIKQFPNSSLSPQVIKLYSQGLTHQQWTKIYQKTQIPPRQAYEIHQQLKSLDNSQLGKEITQPLGKAGRAFQTLTNKISGKLPQGFTKPLNYIFHPIQSIKGLIGKQIGKRLGVKLYKAFAKKVTNKTARLVAKTLLRNGIKQGAKILVKLGIKAGLIAGGVTAPIALVMVAWDAISFVGKKIWGGIQNMAQSIWGEKIKARDLLALPVAAAASFGAILTGLGAATMAAASSAAGTIVASAVAGIFIYIVAFTVAPLISTIAQLENQPGLEYNFSGGPIPPGCPSIWPVDTSLGNYSITQGPQTNSTHYGVEAIDIGGDMIPILATHPGRAIAVGSSGPYGNYVDITGICEGINFITRYAHMPAVPFYGEKLVNTGDTIGITDDTGNSTGPHLHYEIRGGTLGDINQFLPTPVTPGCIGRTECAQMIP
ncbi:M23 family metallopeptidase [Patescibacteria group bacterium]|nr:M23 family metallopeptidase [Patescibacteria group bacterium]